MKKRIYRDEQGYTLIEILAVLVLLGFLITLVAPNIIKKS